MVDELGRRKLRRVLTEKRSKKEKEQEEQEAYDNLAQKWDCLTWEQEEVELWRRVLKMREIAMGTIEAAVFQRELEYRRLERCPLCGNRERRDETRRQEGQIQDEVIANRTTVGVRTADEATARQNAPNGRPCSGQPLQRALRQGNEHATKNMNV